MRVVFLTVEGKYHYHLIKQATKENKSLGNYVVRYSLKMEI